MKAKTRENGSNKQSKTPDSSTGTHRPAHPREKKKKKIHTKDVNARTMAGVSNNVLQCSRTSHRDDS